jgi:acetolactate decarboxylase
MRKLIALVAVVLWLTGCQSAPRDTVTQFSTIDAVLAGAYDGQMSLGELRRHGDFGIGTFHALDGEMILLDGVFYQVRADGVVARPEDSVLTPFASVVSLRPECVTLIAQATDFAAFRARTDAAVPNLNNFCAVKAVGRFSSVKVRSVPAQKKPYPPLVEVTKNQSVFTARDIRGTLVGFRTPDFGKGVNVPGYHIHFLSEDRAFGGHVLDFTMEEGSIQLDYCPKLFLILPEAGDFGKINLGVDRTMELEKAEK